MSRSLFRQLRAKRPRGLPADRLAVFGRVQGGLLRLSKSDLEGMPGRHRTSDVAAFAAGETGRAIRLRAIIDQARPVPGTLYVNFEDRDGRHRFSHFLADIQELGWIRYPPEHESRTGQEPGLFRLILPGMPIGRSRMDDLAWIEFADRDLG